MVWPRRKSSKKLPGVVLVMTFLVMAGLDPAIHVFMHRSRNKTWMPGTRPGMTNVRTRMPTYNLLLLPGDGIGPEVMAEVKKLIAWMNAHRMGTFTTEEGLCGGCAYDAHGASVTDETVAKAKAADAVIFGSVGGPKWDKVPYEHRPEAGLLRLRKDLELYANLRPAVTYPALADASSLKRELVEGLDIMILRELTGGVYFGEPRGVEDLPGGGKRAVDTQGYTPPESERIAAVGFELAAKRRNHVTSVEKANVMHTGVLWRQTVQALHDSTYP